MHIAGQAEVSRVDDLVCARVVENGLGVDACLVCEGTEARDGVVERRVDLDGFGDEIFDLLGRVSWWQAGQGYGKCTSLSL